MAQPQPERLDPFSEDSFDRRENLGRERCARVGIRQTCDLPLDLLVLRLFCSKVATSILLLLLDTKHGPYGLFVLDLRGSNLVARMIAEPLPDLFGFPSLLANGKSVETPGSVLLD